MMNFTTSITMFVVGLVTDVLLAIYYRNLSGNTKVAAIFSVGTGICSIIFVDLVVKDLNSSVFWLAGLYIGTRISKKIEAYILGAIEYVKRVF